MKSIGILFALLISITAYSQRVITYNTQPEIGDGIFDNPNFLLKRNAFFDLTFSDYKNHDYIPLKEIKGTPYNHEDFTKGIITYRNKNLDTLFYRYNSYQDQIEIKRQQNDSAYFSLNKEFNIGLLAKEGHYISKQSLEDGKIDLRFFKVVFPEAPELLFERIKTTFTEGKVAENSMVKSTPHRFTTSSTYYFYRFNGLLIPLETNTKKFLKEFPESLQPSLKNFLKKERIDLKDLTDLKKLMPFIYHLYTLEKEIN